MKKQNGFVSIIVAAVLMVLLSLITIGFSRVMQREQRQAIDRQLSSQAFYAAETAVNDVKAKISLAGSVIGKTDCDVSSWSNGIIDFSTPDIRYSCLLIDPAPTSLEFDNGKISQDKSKVFTMKTKSGNPFNTFKFEWTGADGNTIDPLSNCSLTLPTNFSSTSVPILRLDITPTSSVSRSALTSSSRAFFLYPASSACGTNAAGFTPTQTGSLIPVNCDAAIPFVCSFKITGLTENQYIVRAKTVYSDAAMRVTASTTSDSGPFSTQLVEAQTVVDATGRAGDVLKRVIVRLSNKDPQAIPEATTQSYQGICKLYKLVPPSDVTTTCP